MLSVAEQGNLLSNQVLFSRGYSMIQDVHTREQTGGDVGISL